MTTTSLQEEPKVSTVVMLFESLPFTLSATGVLLWSHSVLYRWLQPAHLSIKDSHQHTHSRRRFSLRDFSLAPWLLVLDLTMAASVVIAELVLCEIGEWVNAHVRATMWKLSTSAILLCLVVMIPLLQISSWFTGSFEKVKISMTAAVFGLWLFLFFELGRLIPHEQDTSTQSGWLWNLSKGSLSRIGFIGITAMGVLSGFGAVSAPYTQFLYKPRPVTDLDLERISRSVETTGELINTKHRKLTNVRQKIRERMTKGGHSNVMNKIFNTFSGDSLDADEKSLQTEIGALQHMRAGLESDLKQARARYQEQCDAKTPTGRVMTVCHVVFAVYCIYRLVVVLLLKNPYINAQGHTDALASTLAHFAAYMYPTTSAEGWTRQIGFALSGLLFLGSISSVITTIHTLKKAFPWMSDSAKPMEKPNGHNSKGLFVAHLLGTYVISTSLMLRSNLPEEMSSAITAALGAPLDVQFVQHWFDYMFMITAVVSIIGVYIANRLQAADNEAFYDEENLVEKHD